MDSLITDNNNDKDYKLINTGTIDPYVNLWGIKAIAYLKNKYLYPVVKRESFASKFPKRVRQASSPKIIITGMRYFECFYDEKGDFIAGKSTIILLNPKKNSDIKFILGILNSKLIAYFIRESYKTSGVGGGINFSKDMVKQLPVPQATQEQQQPIIDLVDKILAAKAADHNADTSADEHKIDLLVYHLYELTFEEAKVIDPELKEEEFGAGK